MNSCTSSSHSPPTPAWCAEPVAAPSADEPRPTLEELKRRYVLTVLDEHGGNVSRAATVLGIDRRSLHRMLHRFGGSARARAGEIVATGGDERDEARHRLRDGEELEREERTRGGR